VRICSLYFDSLLKEDAKVNSSLEVQGFVYLLFTIGNDVIKDKVCNVLSMMRVILQQDHDLDSTLLDLWSLLGSKS
jgi:hypothetical protein